MPWHNLKTHCHTPDLDTEKIVLISENLQNLEIGQLYLDKGLKQIASKQAGRNIDTKQEKKEMGIQIFFIDLWMEWAAGAVLLKSHFREEFCSKQGAEM